MQCPLEPEIQEMAFLAHEECLLVLPKRPLNFPLRQHNKGVLIRQEPGRISCAQMAVFMDEA